MAMEPLGGLGRTALAASPLKFTAEDSGICSVAPNETGPIGIIGTAMEDWVIRKGLKGGLFPSK